jgi:hypothetical protein
MLGDLIIMYEACFLYLFKKKEEHINQILLTTIEIYQILNMT